MARPVNEEKRRVAVHVHPSAVVGPGVELDDGVRIGPHAVVLGPARLHEDVQVGPGAVIGTPPEITTAVQNAAWAGELEHHSLVIGSRTVIRELSTIHQGSSRPTTIGADCWLLNRTYVAHDCRLEDGVTLSAGASLGGFVVVGLNANVGMNTAVHQHRRIGALGMVGMGAVVTRDLPPFAKSYGAPAAVRGVNAVGLARAGFTEADIAALEELYAGESRVPLASVPAAFHPVISAWWETTPERAAVTFEAAPTPDR